ncbi:hypothetical protein ACFXB3_11600, partial [Streptomyces sp. NPDC059447]
GRWCVVVRPPARTPLAVGAARGLFTRGAPHPRDGSFALTVTAATTRPFRFWFPLWPTAAEVRAAIDDTVRPDEWFDDIHGAPAWRRHMALHLAEQIRVELTRPTRHTRHTLEEASR